MELTHFPETCNYTGGGVSALITLPVPHGDGRQAGTPLSLLSLPSLPSLSSQGDPFCHPPPGSRGSGGVNRENGAA